MPGSGEERTRRRRRQGARPLVFEDFLVPGRPKSDSIGPWLVAALLVANGLVGLCSAAWFEVWACWFEAGWFPRRGRDDLLDLTASLLVHASVWDLLANVVFLVAYGRAVVHREGEAFWLLVVGGGALLGGFAQKLAVLPTGGPAGPFAGIGAGVGALVVWVATSAPHARIGLPYRASGRWRELTWPALGGAVVWIALQMALLDTGAAPTAGLAALALGVGAAFGGVLAFARPCGGS
jgi:membrane associated rhomboid family serine protease